MNEEITIFGIAGSIRRHSYNRMALNTAKELMPGGVTLDIFADLAAIPPFNEDTEFMPEPIVVDLKARIRNASGVLIVTPEYNYGIPGVLKNAIDQASRPSGDNVWMANPWRSWARRSAPLAQRGRSISCDSPSSSSTCTPSTSPKL